MIVKHARLIISTLSVGAVLVGSSACISEPESAPASSSEVQGSNSSGPATETAQQTPAPQAEELYPALKRTPGEDDQLPAKADLGNINRDSVRWLGSSSYTAQFIATDSEDNLCFIAWATPGHGDATPVDYGSPGIQCSTIPEVQQQGLSVRVDQGEGSDGLVAHLLPPDMEMPQVKKTILAIPGNHQDLRPPVEIMDNVDHSITLAMGTETADDLGGIEIPRPDGETLALTSPPETDN